MLSSPTVPTTELIVCWATEVLRLAATHDPPPAGVPTPRTWGREERLRVELELHSPTARTDLAQVSLGPR